MKEWFRPLELQHTMWLIANVQCLTLTLEETGRSGGITGMLRWHNLREFIIKLQSTYWTSLKYSKAFFVHPWTQSAPTHSGQTSLCLSELFACFILFIFIFKILTLRHACEFLPLISTITLKCSNSHTFAHMRPLTQKNKRLQINSTQFGSWLARSCQGETDFICWSAKENFIDWLTQNLDTSFLSGLLARFMDTGAIEADSRSNSTSVIKACCKFSCSVCFYFERITPLIFLHRK